MIEKIKQLADHYFSEIVHIRRHLHQYPELSFEEQSTSDYISEQLSLKGIKHERNWGGHGIVVDLVQDEKLDTIALRADIDALPIAEKNEVEYKSKNEGVMHACGHDVHTANLLGATFILNDLREELKYNYRIIFQPAEEKLPGGASILIKEGVLRNPVPKCIIGLHVFPSLETGSIGFRSGMYMASADEIYIEIVGKGGHAAMPHNNVDPILIASSTILNLQQIVARRTDPTIPCVLSLGKINSIGGATNITPDKVLIEGTFRTMDEKWRAKAHDLIEKSCKATAEAYGGQCNIEIRKGYPFLVNDPHVTERSRSAAIDYLNDEKVKDLPIRMTSEDFAFYSHEIPACFFRLGTGNEKKGITASVHTPFFDVDEECLRIGSGLMAYIAMNQ